MTKQAPLKAAPKPKGKIAPDGPSGIRLQKLLAEAGIASRRKAEEIILEGRVEVNGAVVTELGTRAEIGKDHIRVDGKLLQRVQEHRYFMVNKPRGYVTTMSDPEHRGTVVDLLRETALKSGRKLDVRLYPVGRLDYNSEGLLLMTNDGDLANNLSKAANSVAKTYLVKVAGQPTEEMLQQLRTGVMIDRGRLAEVRGTRRDRVLTSPAKVELVRRGENPWYEVTLTEGRNRQLRKMFEEIGHHVEKIRRIGYGALTLDVPIGDFRELTQGEVQALGRAAAGMSVQRKQRPSEHAQLKKSGQKTGSRGARPRF